MKSRELEYANLEGIPSFFDYWAYMYFCGASISGPFYEYKDFQLYMKSQKHYKDIPSTVVPTLMRVKDLAIFICI